MMKSGKAAIFVSGPVSPSLVADAIAKHSAKTGIGAHDIFLGQVRADATGDRVVEAIEYTCYQEMADEKLREIREEAFSRFEISCMHIYHSTGIVKAGELSLFVFVSSAHRAPAFEACHWIVEKIKEQVPVWGREIFGDGTHRWKLNTAKNQDHGRHHSEVQ